MRRLLISILLFLATTAMFAADTDTLLTPNGTLYTIESTTVEDSSSTRSLRLTISDESSERQIFVPETTHGRHIMPSLAYDSRTETLFIVWQKTFSTGSGELLLCSYRDGGFTDTESIERAAFHLRSNLRIGTTRNTIIDDAGEERSVLNLHAVWWDDASNGEFARYAMITVDGGAIQSIQRFELREFIGINGDSSPGLMETELDRELFRHPTIFEQPSREEIEVLFGDASSARFHRVKLAPKQVPVTENGVLTIPIGVWQGEIDPPGRAIRPIAGAVLSILSTSKAGDYVFAFASAEKMLEYSIVRDGKWGRLTGFPLKDKIAPHVAFELLKRMAAAD